jgi:serine/threonine-protein kinase
MSLSLNALDDRIELKGRTGSGAMGEVHRAWDDQLERAVAVKFQLASDDREAERLLLEARLQARVEHPNVIKVHEVGTLQGRVCIVFQLVDGPTLGELAKDLTIQERVELLRQAALGLHAAHLQGLVHRDVKPGNVLVETGLDGARRALLGDFGLARAEEGGLSRTGVPTGTLEYMSPEQLLGNGPVDFRSDIYALGATLYALLAGRPPFRSSAEPGGEEDSSGLFRRVLEEEPEPLHRAVPGTPRELGLVAARAMEKSPAARYPTAEAFAEELGRFLRGEPVQAQAPTLLDRGVKWARRNRIAARALAGAAVVILTAAGLAAWSSRQASLEALEAARLGAAAASLESRLRMEFLSEPHDLRPTLAAIRAEVERLRPLAGRGSGPASYALGKGLELLDDLDGARVAYQGAERAGFQAPESAVSMGLVLGRTYLRERARAKEVLTPEALQQRIGELRAEFLEPARHHLEAGAPTGWLGTMQGAQVALFEGDYPAARTRAAEVLIAAPAHYEARLVEGESWLGEGRELLDDHKLAEAAAALERASAPLEAAVRAGRSDPAPLSMLAEAASLGALMRQRRGLDPGPLADAALAWAARALALNPASAKLLLSQGRALETRGLYAQFTRPDAMLPYLEKATPLFRKAVELEPRQLRPRNKLAYNLYARTAGALEFTGKVDWPDLREGLAMAASARELAPGDDEAMFITMLLRGTEAAMLQKEGRAATEPLRAALAQGEAILRLPGVNPAQTLEVMSEYIAGLAREEWLEGHDPRPSLSRSLEIAERSAAGKVAEADSSIKVAVALTGSARLRLALGEDVAPALARAGAVLEEATRAHPDVGLLSVLRGEVLARSASLGAELGHDPSPAIAEASPLLAPVEFQKQGDVMEAKALLHLASAAWRGRRGIDPSLPLAQAEQILSIIMKADPKSSSGLSALATCELLRSRWLGRPGSGAARVPAAAAAGRGLGLVARALEVEPRDPEAHVLKARLQSLAGDRAAARQSLDRAYAIQPLVKGSREARAAEAELAR